jgi:hypothetical protein
MVAALTKSGILSSRVISENFYVSVTAEKCTKAHKYETEFYITDNFINGPILQQGYSMIC